MAKTKLKRRKIKCVGCKKKFKSTAADVKTRKADPWKNAQSLAQTGVGASGAIPGVGYIGGALIGGAIGGLVDLVSPGDPVVACPHCGGWNLWRWSREE